MVEFFLAGIIFWSISLFAYGYFRSGISAYCSLMKLSRKFIKRAKKGAANYWLYKQLHQQKGLGSFYYLNLLFLFCLLAFAFLLCFSWAKWMRIPVVIAGIVLGLVEIPAIFKASICIHREEFGKAFVLFRVCKGCNGKSIRYATVFDQLFCIVPLATYILLLTGISW